MNEETIIQNPQRTNAAENTQPVEEKKKGAAWKHVMLGGVPGILMGAGMMYATTASAQEQPKPTEAEQEAENEAEQNADENAIDNDVAVTSTNVGTPAINIATQHSDIPFDQAFAAARAEVGPGGVFHWHGGIYNTYTAEEWAAMTTEQKNNFAMRVHPEIHPDEVSTPTDVHPDAIVQPTPTTETHTVSDTGDVQVLEQQIAQNFNMGEDVHIVGYANAEGHLVVGYDSTGNGQADIAIIDIDNDLHPSDVDIIMDTEGNMATLGELNNDSQPNQMTTMENPEVAPDMPDYMNDANLGDTNILA